VAAQIFVHYTSDLKMFVRWQKRRSTRSKYQRWKEDPGTVWAAVVVESVRVNGKPQQRHVAYLGTFSQRRLDQIDFDYWERVTERLDRFDDRLSADDRAKIENMLAEKIQRVTVEQYDEWCREREAFLDTAPPTLAALRPRGQKYQPRKPLPLAAEREARWQQRKQDRLRLRDRTRERLKVMNQPRSAPTLPRDQFQSHQAPSDAAAAAPSATTTRAVQP
jgi:hypothetical protein